MRRVIAMFHSSRFRPPPGDDPARKQREDAEMLAAALIAVLGPDADAIRVPPEEAAHLIRCLTFATTHPMLAGPVTYTPQLLVDRLLHGVGGGGRTC